MSIKNSITTIIIVSFLFSFPTQAELCVVATKELFKGTWEQLDSESGRPGGATWAFKKPPDTSVMEQGIIECSGDCSPRSGKPVSWELVSKGILIRYEDEAAGSPDQALSCEITDDKLIIGNQGQPLLLFRREKSNRSVASDATFNQTHAFIRTMILNQRIIYEQPQGVKTSGKFQHWHDVNYGVTTYSANNCQVSYGRKLSRSAVHGHAASSSKKGVSFNMAQVDRITVQAWSDFDPRIGRSTSQPSETIMFHGPATVMSNGVGSKRTSHGITVYSANSEEILKALQHLKKLCTP